MSLNSNDLIHMRAIPGGIGAENVVLVRSLPAPCPIPVAGREFYFITNPRVKLRLAARGRTKTPQARLTSAI